MFIRKFFGLRLLKIGLFFDGFNLLVYFLNGEMRKKSDRLVKLYFLLYGLIYIVFIF